MRHQEMARETEKQTLTPGSPKPGGGVMPRQKVLKRLGGAVAGAVERLPPRNTSSNLMLQPNTCDWAILPSAT